MDFDDLVAQQGWNTDSKLMLMEQFLTQKKLWPEFTAHAQSVADEENGNASAAPAPRRRPRP